MKSKHNSILFIFVLLFLAGACKKVVPTGPTGSDPNNGQPEQIHFSATILLNGAPFANVDVYLSGDDSKKVQSGADGTFGFFDLPAGTYYITLSRQGYSFSPAYLEFKVSIDNYTFTAQIATYGSEEGIIMADFSALNQNNQNVSLYDFFGQIVLINFSADWCEPCRSEASQLNSLFTLYRERGFHIITVLINGDNALWANEYSLEFPVLDDRIQSIYQIYRTGYIPLNILINRNGHILYKDNGYNQYIIEDWIKKFL